MWQPDTKKSLSKTFYNGLYLHSALQWRSQPKSDARIPIIPHATNLNVEPIFMKTYAKMPNLFGHAYMQYF